MSSKSIQLIAIIAVIILVVILLLYFLNRARKRRAVNIALQEYKKWNSGMTRETDPAMKQTLTSYWNAAESKDYGYGAAWSAAFISYIMKMAGAGNNFPYASSHSVYIRQAIKNKKSGAITGFLGFKPNEYKPKVGDLICFPRQSGVTYDSTGAYDSHCDIVVDINRATGELITIGGNVSNSVTKTVYEIDSNGFVITPKVFAVLTSPL